MPRSTKPAHEVQIQASETTQQLITGIDEFSMDRFKFVKKYAKEVLGMNLSDSVIIRRCIQEMYLTLLEQMIKSYDAKDKGKIMERLMTYQESNRQMFLKAACKD